MTMLPKPPKPEKITCVVCSHQWEDALPDADGYYECKLCGYMNSLPWMPDTPPWKQDND